MHPGNHRDNSPVNPERDFSTGHPWCDKYFGLSRLEQIEAQAEVLRRIADIAPHEIGSLLLSARANLLDYAHLLNPRSQITMLKPWPGGRVE